MCTLAGVDAVWQGARRAHGAVEHVACLAGAHTPGAMAWRARRSGCRRQPMARSQARVIAEAQAGCSGLAGTQSQGPRRDRTGRGRAGFRHAGQHQGSGDRRDQSRRDQVHAGLRHPRAAQGDRRQVQARERARLRLAADNRRHRRQADPVQRADGDAEPGR
jgi:hypothetical protein